MLATIGEEGEYFAARTYHSDAILLKKLHMTRPCFVTFQVGRSRVGMSWERTLRPHRTLRIKDNPTRLGMDLAAKWISNNFFLSRIIYINRTLYYNKAL